MAKHEKIVFQAVMQQVYIELTDGEVFDELELFPEYVRIWLDSAPDTVQSTYEESLAAGSSLAMTLRKCLKGSDTEEIATQKVHSKALMMKADLSAVLRKADPARGDLLSLEIYCSNCNDERSVKLDENPLYEIGSGKYVAHRSSVCPVCRGKKSYEERLRPFQVPLRKDVQFILERALREGQKNVAAQRPVKESSEEAQLVKSADFKRGPVLDDPQEVYTVCQQCGKTEYLDTESEYEKSSGKYVVRKQDCPQCKGRRKLFIPKDKSMPFRFLAGFEREVNERNQFS